MDKFDQPELHPRGFPLWMEILLVSALILTPLIVVSLYQAWQDSRHKQDTPATQSKVTEIETKTASPAEVKTESGTEIAPENSTTNLQDTSPESAKDSSSEESAKTSVDTSTQADTADKQPAESK
ncbi:MAG: hypothetical protein IT342_17800 [Candidatus Melainabacteria bacterium]|nr:hypothetical protein [Candidatus Melainabacteria bacterium]